MNLKFTATTNNKIYDITEIVTDPKWFTSIDGQPGKLTFNILVDKSVFLKNGDGIEFYVDNKKYFKGRVFIHGKNKKGFWKITAYDQMRYLQNEDTIVFGASTASERFKKICELQGITYKIGKAPGYRCAASIEDSKTYFSMLEDALEETRISANNSRYTVYDDAGTLKFVALEELNSNLLVGDDSLVTDYDYESSIDEVFNVVKVIREDEKNKTRQVYTASDAKLIDKWGKLQKVESATKADMNAQQLQKQANDALNQSKNEKTTFHLPLIGTMALQAGNSFNLELSDLDPEFGKKRRVLLIHQCTHTFLPVHTMELDVEVVY